MKQWDHIVEDHITISHDETESFVDMPVLIGWQLDCENEMEWDVIWQTNGVWDEVPAETLEIFETIAQKAMAEWIADQEMHYNMEKNDAPDEGLVCGHCGWHNWRIKC